ncbi:hypothetical protein Taro_038750 [Colocasia esculenta]|uniref:RING-type domain-containing protein n=1 Tax=Colocasia esculenta TaxID=4460 RepID=A0A843WK59_COLES|nr:hypothetical protein [Colocasia esculenta]
MSSSFISSPLPDSAAPANGVGLGYGIAIAVGILVLISTIMLASYVCVRVKGGGQQAAREGAAPVSAPAAVVLDVVATVGLDGATIESYPKFVYGGAHGGPQPKPAGGPCPICLSEYRPGETMRRIPECEHCFHAGCVDEWLRVSATCPVCRNSPVPSAATTPLATPLSELIPLAVHAASRLGPTRTKTLLKPRTNYSNQEFNKHLFMQYSHPLVGMYGSMHGLLPPFGGCIIELGLRYIS